MSFAETPMILCEAQQSIDELLSRHPHDDCGGVPRLSRLWDARCRKAVGDLQKLSARSLEGLRAKAEALVDPKLIQDYASHRKIAVSLADDLLRYFGARVA